MHSLSLAIDGAWKVLLAGLVLGAGLPTLFAVGVRSMAYGQGGDAEVHAPGVRPSAHPLGQLIGYLCFAVVLLAVALGITYIVASGFGKMLSFDHIYPTLVKKH